MDSGNLSLSGRLVSGPCYIWGMSAAGTCRRSQTAQTAEPWHVLQKPAAGAEGPLPALSAAVAPAVAHPGCNMKPDQRLSMSRCMHLTSLEKASAAWHLKRSRKDWDQKAPISSVADICHPSPFLALSCTFLVVWAAAQMLGRDMPLVFMITGHTAGELH